MWMHVFQFGVPDAIGCEQAATVENLSPIRISRVAFRWEIGYHFCRVSVGLCDPRAA